MRIDAPGMPPLVWLPNIAAYVRQLPESDPRLARYAAATSGSSYSSDLPAPDDPVLVPFAAGQPHPTIADYDALIGWLIATTERLNAV